MLAEVISTPWDFLGAAVTTIGVVATAFFAYRAAVRGKQAVHEVKSGNGKPTGQYITGMDAKLDLLLERQDDLRVALKEHESADREQFAELRGLVMGSR